MRASLAVVALATAASAVGALGAMPLHVEALLAGMRAGAAAWHGGETPSRAFGRGAEAVSAWLQPHAARIAAYREKGPEGRRVGAHALPAGSPGAAPLGAGWNPMPEGYARFLPSLLGTVSLDGTQRLTNVVSRCFDRVSVRVASAPPAGQGGNVTVSIVTSMPNATSCEDLISVGYDGALNFASISAAGTTNLTFSLDDTPAGAVQWAWTFGLNVYVEICDGELGCAGDVLDTVSMFVPALTEQYLDPSSEAINRNFLQNYVNVTYQNRSGGITPVDMSFAQTGDLLVIHRADGLASLEQWLSGEASSHIAMFYRMPPDNTLYVVESTDKTSYWPNPNIQKTQYDPQWLAMAVASNYSIAVLPLKAELRAQFNNTAAELYLASSLGDPYGYHNFIWTVIDTPSGSLPWPLTQQFLENLFAIIEALDEDIANTFINMAMEKRLNTTQSLTIPQQALMAKQQLGISWPQLYSMPEQDAWVYPDGPSLVCDSYATAIYKAAGLFPGLTINAAEFTNSGIYNVNFFDLANSTHDPRPLACQQTDPGIPYCMLMGNYIIPLKTASSVTPYSHMQESCSGLPPLYQQPFHC